MGCFLLRTLHLCGCLRSQIPRTSFFPLGFLLFSWCHAQARRAVVGLLRVSFSHTIVGVQYLFGRICLAVCGKVRLVGRVRSGHRWHRYSFIFFRSLLAVAFSITSGSRGGMCGWCLLGGCLHRRLSFECSVTSAGVVERQHGAGFPRMLRHSAGVAG